MWLLFLGNSIEVFELSDLKLCLGWWDLLVSFSETNSTDLHWKSLQEYFYPPQSRVQWVAPTKVTCIIIEDRSLFSVDNKRKINIRSQWHSYWIHLQLTISIVIIAWIEILVASFNEMYRASISAGLNDNQCQLGLIEPSDDHALSILKPSSAQIKRETTVISHLHRSRPMAVKVTHILGLAS